MMQMLSVFIAPYCPLAVLSENKHATVESIFAVVSDETCYKKLSMGSFVENDHSSCITLYHLY